MNVSEVSATRFLARPEGRISYTDDGPVGAPLLVAVPGMGDLRGTWRDVVPALVAAGYRVAVSDLRGHGDSDTSFRTHGDEATAADILALVDELGGPAVLLGNSMAGSAAIIAASERPDAVSGLVLISPFAREAQSPAAQRVTRLLFRLLFARPWGATVWSAYYRSVLNKGATASWLGEHVSAIRGSMRDAGHLRALRDLAVQLDHSVVEPHLSRVSVPVLIAVGALDPDYRDPAGELMWMAEHLCAETMLVEGAAHYAHHQRPDIVVPRILSFLDGIRASATGWTHGA